MKSLIDGTNGDKKPLINVANNFKTLPVAKIEKRKISFSFLFFKQIKNFGISGKADTWFSGLLEQLKVISGKEFDDLVGDPAIKKYFRLHPLEFGPGISALSKEDFAFIPNEYLPKGEDCEYWQFQISKANGRIVGFFNEDHSIFYLVFLDPNHNAQLSEYSDYKVRPIEPQISEIDDLYSRIAKLIDIDETLQQKGAEILYKGENIYMCIEKELFSEFDKLMNEGSLQTQFQEFLLERLDTKF